MQRGQLLLGQRIAVCVGAAVHADEQDVDRAVLAVAAQGGGIEVEDAALEGVDLAPCDTGADHDRHRDERQNRARDPPGTRHRRHFGVSWHQPRLLARWAHTR